MTEDEGSSLLAAVLVVGQGRRRLSKAITAGALMNQLWSVIIEKQWGNLSQINPTEEIGQ